MAVKVPPSGSREAAAAALARSDGDGGLAVSEFLVSLVESLWSASVNGKTSKMESANKAQSELEKIEQQIEQLESLAGRIRRLAASCSNFTNA